ncbi:AAA family ATPase [Scytonema sp. PRP1]|uniref:AAA family ATPase n=1 Tax=Scytonema sp. PRP1 TaxID=3120513 RepID=UPI002FD3152F
MLKQLILENWKSFRYAELPIDPLTVLIGTNASGKSNVVEALEFLQRIVRGEDIEAALAGDKTLPSIRGGVEWAALKNETQFTIKALVQGEEETKDYLYSITIQTKPFVRASEVYIICQEYQEGNQDAPINYYLMKSEIGDNTLSHKLHIYSARKSDTSLLVPEQVISTNPQVRNNYIKYQIGRKDNEYFKKDKTYANLQGINTVFDVINNFFILNPIPSQMRDYSLLSEKLESDASNIAGVLAALPEEEKAEVEATISAYVKNLPEGDIQRVLLEVCQMALLDL